MKQVTVSLMVEDATALHAAALAHLRNQGLDEEDIAHSLRYADGSINENACLVMLLDPGSLPGCEIIDSSVA